MELSTTKINNPHYFLIVKYLIFYYKKQNSKLLQY